MDVPVGDMARRNSWVVLTDPEAKGTDGSDVPPPEIIVGGWQILDDNSTGPFRPNPKYRPSGPEVPTDPVDAVLRLFYARRSTGTDLAEAIRDAIVEISCDSGQQPVVVKSPDDKPCVVVVTAEVQKANLEVSRWVPVHGKKLPDIIPPNTDVLINPGSGYVFRLLGDALLS